MAKAKKAPKKAVKKKPVMKAKAKPKAKLAAKKPVKAKVMAKKAKVAAKPVPKKVAKPVEKAPVEPKSKAKGKAIEAKQVETPVEVEPVEAQAPEEVILTDAEGRRYCRVKDCDQLASVDAYCRYHYLLFWKRIQIRKKILTEGKLERYIEELTARYPDKFLDMLRKDLRSEKEFLAAIQELEIDESQAEGEFEEENENIIDEVRGMSETPERSEEEF